MSENSGGFRGPSWADFWLAAAAIESELRCRVLVRLGGSRVRKSGSVVELLLVRHLRPATYYVIAHVDDFFPSRRHQTMPALLGSLLLTAQRAGHEYDARPHQQLQLLDLPFPPGDERHTPQ
jgi:hypothetical protein